MNKEELLINLEELEAYRSLNGKSFDFGSGPIVATSMNNEDVYWKMEQQGIEDRIEDFNHTTPKTRKRYKPNRYERKYIKRSRLEEIHKEVLHAVWYDKKKEIYKRCYYSGRKRLAKKQTNKKIRRIEDFSANRSSYKKLYDYWGTVF